MRQKLTSLDLTSRESDQGPRFYDARGSVETYYPKKKEHQCYRKNETAKRSDNKENAPINLRKKT